MVESAFAKAIIEFIFCAHALFPIILALKTI